MTSNQLFCTSFILFTSLAFTQAQECAPDSCQTKKVQNTLDQEKSVKTVQAITPAERMENGKSIQCHYNCFKLKPVFDSENRLVDKNQIQIDEGDKEYYQIKKEMGFTVLRVGPNCAYRESAPFFSATVVVQDNFVSLNIEEDGRTSSSILQIGGSIPPHFKLTGITDNYKVRLECKKNQ